MMASGVVVIVVDNCGVGSDCDIGHDDDCQSRCSHGNVKCCFS
jgi:hypothetical protein